MAASKQSDCKCNTEALLDLEQELFLIGEDSKMDKFDLASIESLLESDKLVKAGGIYSIGNYPKERIESAVKAYLFEQKAKHPENEYSTKYQFGTYNPQVPKSPEALGIGLRLTAHTENEKTETKNLREETETERIPNCVIETRYKRWDERVSYDVYEEEYLVAFVYVKKPSNRISLIKPNIHLLKRRLAWSESTEWKAKQKRLGSHTYGPCL